MKFIVLLFAATTLCTVGCGSEWDSEVEHKITAGENVNQPKSITVINVYPDVGKGETVTDSNLPPSEDE